jgi:hypothetical protein
MTDETTTTMRAPLCACSRPITDLDLDTLELRCIRCARLVDGLPTPISTTEKDR